ncbi:MAG: NfeD family protein [Clostridia bacterium]|nr:NfeD family protein [Clostridia bacterium]
MIWFWLAVVVVSIAIELVTYEMVAVWFIPSGIICMILEACGVGELVQIVVFIIVSLILMLTLRKAVLKYLTKDGDDNKTGLDTVIGKEYRLITPIALNQPGTVKVNGTEWNVVTNNDEDELPEKTLVKVKAIKGNKLIVEEVIKEEPSTDTKKTKK